LGSLYHPPVGKGPGGIGRPIGAVGACAEHGRPLPSCDLHTARKGELLISPPLSFTPDGHGGFTAGDDAGRRGKGFARADDLFQDGPVDLGHFPGLPFDKG
jgi:hypothetical protein